ncbi:MAG: MotA/TolQ/ExbB proton channel family protein [Ignavibacteriae bacterium]|nr:MotA/TolQ/ExbB proton channel family protein [Ignavibacteriota bacterium]
MDVLVWFQRGGVVMYPILLCSLVGVYIIIERWLTLRAAKPPTGAFQLKLRKMLEGNNIQLAQEVCIQEKSPVGRVISAGLEKIHHGPMRVRQAMEDQGREEITLLDRHLGVLASIAGIAPMLGFLGTVTGLVVAFQSVAAAAGQPSPADLADGIWEALMTTVFGLVVGIPVAAAYNYLLNKVQIIASSYERIARDTLDAIEECVYHGKFPSGEEETVTLRREEATA